MESLFIRTNGNVQFLLSGHSGSVVCNETTFSNIKNELAESVRNTKPLLNLEMAFLFPVKTFIKLKQMRNTKLTD